MVVVGAEAIVAWAVFHVVHVDDVSVTLYLNAVVVPEYPATGVNVSTPVVGSTDHVPSPAMTTDDLHWLSAGSTMQVADLVNDAYVWVLVESNGEGVNVTG